MSDHAGSSPLARGTPLDGLGRRRALRFIPARAGNTRCAPGRRAMRAVHPRSRGEHARVEDRSSEGAGSSPLARGTPQDPQLHDADRRFIPARAGNTYTRGPAPQNTAVHPRSRGEHVHGRPDPAGVRRFIPARAGNTSTGAPTPQEYDGSSPLARGTPTPSLPGGFVERFIPARAGNTQLDTRSERIDAVHPRSRGEHSLSA